MAYVLVTDLSSYLFLFAFIDTSFCVCSFRGHFDVPEEMFWGDDWRLTDVTDVADVVMMSHLQH